MSSTRTNTKNIRKELTALGQEDLSNEIGNVENVKGEMDIENSKQLMDILDEYLDGMYKEVKFGEHKFSASRVLKKVDIVAYLSELELYVDDMVEREALSEEEAEKLYDFAAEIDRNLRS